MPFITLHIVCANTRDTAAVYSSYSFVCLCIRRESAAVYEIL